MLQECLNILDGMNQEDVNVQTLKTLISATLQKNRVFYLEYEGKKLCYKILNHDADFSNGSTFYLTTDSDYSIWCTTDLIAAIYAKYVNTEWYNSTLDTPTRAENIDTDKIKVVDNYGNVYNRKPLTIRTCHIIKHKIFGHELNNELLNSPYYAGLYDNLYLLEEAKERYQRNRLKFDVGLQACSLSDLQDMRKQLVKEKGEKVSQNKPYKRIQNKLDKVNKAIRNLGGM